MLGRPCVAWAIGGPSGFVDAEGALAAVLCPVPAPP